MNIQAHKNQLILIAPHLISNIIKFNKSGQPEITIACEKISHTDDNSLQAKAGKYYLLSIKHNGYGFQKVDPFGIFEGMEKRIEENTKNSVIDFVLVTKIMEAHAGFLIIEEIGEENTDVKYYFPVS